MAEDWVKLFLKFSAANRSLAPELAKYTLDDADEIWKTLEARDKAMEVHEKKLGAAAIDAYKAGVSSKKLAEFMKDKAFATAKGFLDADRKLLVAELKLLEAHCEKCKASTTKAYTLAQEMAKALLADKTKVKNPEREKVEKLREGLMEQFDELSRAEKVRYKVPKYMKVFDAQYDKLIDHLIAEALKKGRDPAEEAEVPQPLSDKKLAAAVKDVGEMGASITETLDKKNKLKVIDEKTLDTAMTKAWDTLEAMRKVQDYYDGLLKKFKKELAAFKERDEILKKVKAIGDEIAKAQKVLKEDANKAGKIV